MLKKHWWWPLFSVLVLAPLVVAWAQDGSNGGVSPDTPAEGVAIETGSVFGPVRYGSEPAPATVASPAILSKHYNDDVLDGVLNVPHGRATALTFHRVQAYTETGVTLGMCSIEASEIWAVEVDPTPGLLGRQTTRLYLRSGGFVIANGHSHGDRGLKDRWLECRSLGEMPAVTQIPEAK